MGTFALNKSDDIRRIETFNRLSEAWSDSHYGQKGSMVDRLNRFGSALVPLVKPNASLLDYGCGTGNLAAHLAAAGYRLTACDESPAMIKQAKSQYAGAHIDWHVVPARLENTHQLGDKSFDAIISSSVLEYVDDVPATLGSLFRCLDPGGWLLATVPNTTHPIRRREPLHRRLMEYSLFRSFIGSTRYGQTFSLELLSRNRMSIDEWAGVLEETGFSPIHQDCQFHSLTLLIAQKPKDIQNLSRA